MDCSIENNERWLDITSCRGFRTQLIPYYFIKSSKRKVNLYSKRPSVLVLALVYMTLGLIIAVVCFLTSLGIKYLPVSTFTLISASQLGFTAVFSFFLNSQKFTPFIINSMVLLTISSVLLMFNSDSGEPNEVSKGKYVMGFIFTICASAGTGFMLTFTQFVLQKVIKSESFEAVMDLIIYESLAATCGILVGVFASKEWKGLKREVGKFELGSTCYVMMLTWTAISWQLFAIGSMGLIYETSSVFCNVISTLSLPVVPVLAFIFAHEKITGLKVIAMLLAMWGFVSYVYQHYLDHCKSKTGDADDNEVTE